MEKELYLITNKLNRFDLDDYSKTINFQHDLAMYLKTYITYFKEEKFNLNYCFEINNCCLGLMNEKDVLKNLKLTTFRLLTNLNDMNLILVNIVGEQFRLEQRGLLKNNKKLSKKQRSDLEMSFKWSISCLNYLNLNINKQFLKTELGEDYYLIENIF